MNTNTSENERDTHFFEFAKLLLKEIEQAGAGMSPQDYSPYRFEKVRRDVIAQRAYDLAVHIVNAIYVSQHRPCTFHELIQDYIPDMTELPPTPPQQPPS